MLSDVQKGLALLYPESPLVWDYSRFREYLGHRLIGTRLQLPAQRLRGLLQAPHRAAHPELIGVYREDDDIRHWVDRSISNGMNCVDVGCHLGAMLSQMLSLSPSGTHFAFEPTPYKVQWLRHKFPQVQVLDVALSDKPGQAEFFLQRKRSGFSGLRVHGDTTATLESFKVDCERLDDVIPENVQIDFLKVDVEGGELDVLRGAERVLRRDRPKLLFECTASGLSAFGFTGREVWELVHDRHGYDVYLIRDCLSGDPPLDYSRFEKAMEYPFQAFNFAALPRGDERRGDPVPNAG